jgi:predicted RNase H-like HicB family nuclease
MRYAIVIEKSPTGFGAYVPDLPACVAVAEDEMEVRDLIREAIELHLEGLREDGQEIPEPAARVEYVDVPHAAWRGRHTSPIQSCRVETSASTFLARRELACRPVLRAVPEQKANAAGLGTGRLNPYQTEADDLARPDSSGGIVASR